MLYPFLKQALFKLAPETAHNLTITTLKHAAAVMPNVRSKAIFQQPVSALGLNFSNPVGVAAGFDKNGEAVAALSRLGFGFVEVGTLTPRPQHGNPKPRLFRLQDDHALINRMGFNNKGIDYFIRVIKQQRYQCVLGVNIGKNKETPNEKAHLDYLYCYEKAYPYADYIVVNVSSPNTPNLRDLQSSHALKQLIEPLCEARERMTPMIGRSVPLLVKVAPDLTPTALQACANTLNQLPVQGVIVSNTSTHRDNLTSQYHVNELGGLSGVPIQALALQTLGAFRAQLRDSIELIGVGGIASQADAIQRFDAGAKLIQLYTGLIYQGPGLLKEILS